MPIATSLACAPSCRSPLDPAHLGGSGIDGIGPGLGQVAGPPGKLGLPGGASIDRASVP